MRALVLLGLISPAVCFHLSLYTGYSIFWLCFRGGCSADEHVHNLGYVKGFISGRSRVSYSEMAYWCGGYALHYVSEVWRLKDLRLMPSWPGFMSHVSQIYRPKMSGNEVLRQFLTVRKHSYKYAPAFQKLHALVNGKKSFKDLRAENNNKLGVKVVLGEKSDLSMCQLADTMVDRLRLSKLGVSVKPAKSGDVYYGHLAAQRNRFAVPSELKYTESSYSSRSIYIWLWTDVQQECPDLFTQIMVGPTSDCNVFTFGHVQNARGGIKPVGGVEEFMGWLEGRTNIFSKAPKLDTRGSNVYVMFSDNFLEMFPTNYNKIFDQIENVLGDQSFVRFSYLSRHPVSYNALNAYPFPPISDMIGPQNNYNINVLTNVQRQVRPLFHMMFRKSCSLWCGCDTHAMCSSLRYRPQAVPVCRTAAESDELWSWLTPQF